VLVAISFLILGVASAIPPTQAWRRIFNNSNVYDAANGMDVDASGYCYFAYVTNAKKTLHLVKIGPAMNVAFDITNTFDVDAQPWGVFVSPKISGKQYVYVLAHYTDLNTGLQDLWAKKYDTSGVPQTLPFFYANDPEPMFVGFYADALGNAMFALGSPYLVMQQFNAAGSETGNSINTAIKPYAAHLNRNTAEWIAAGYDATAGSLEGVSARWGSYNPSTGVASFTHYSDGANDPVAGTSTSVSYALNELPGGYIAIAEDQNLFTPSGVTYRYILDVVSSSGTTYFSYPAGRSGYASGNITQVASYNGFSPIYAVLGVPSGYDVESFSWAGSPLWYHAHRAVPFLGRSG